MKNKENRNRRSRRLRFLAVLLSLSMLFTTSGFQTFAEQIGTEIRTETTKKNANKEKTVSQEQESEGSLILKTDKVSTQKAGEAAKLTVEYSLGSNCKLVGVSTRLYVKNKNVQFPQFSGNTYHDSNSGRVFRVKKDEKGIKYISYQLKPGESFRQEFQFTDPTVKAGSSVSFYAVISVEGNAPANKNVQTTPARITYKAPEKKTQSFFQKIVSALTGQGTKEESAQTKTTKNTETKTETNAESKTGVKKESAAETTTENKAEATVDKKTENNKNTEAKKDTKTEEKYGTYFTYSDENVIVTATAEPEAKLPKNAQLKADPILPGSKEYKKAVDLVERKVKIPEGYQGKYNIYDVYFLVNGEEVEPAKGLVSVTMEFLNPIFDDAEEIGEEYSVLHISDKNKVTDVTDGVDVNGDGSVSAACFSTDSFSQFVNLMLMEENNSSETDLDTSYRVEGAYNENTDRIVWRVYLNEKGNTLPVGQYGSNYTITCTFDKSVSPINSDQSIYWCVGTERASAEFTSVSDKSFTYSKNLNPEEIKEDVYLEFQTELADESEESLANLLPIKCTAEITNKLNNNGIAITDITDTRQVVGTAEVPAGNTSSDLNDFIYSANIIPDDGRGQDGTPTASNGSCRIKLSFRENTDVGGKQFAQTLNYTLPTGITVYEEKTGVIKGAGNLEGENLATYVIRPGGNGQATLTITFNDYINGQPFSAYTNLDCNIEFSSWFSLSADESEGEKTFTIGNNNIKLYFEKGNNWSGSKTSSTYTKGINGAPGYFEYTVEVQSDTAIAAGETITITDSMDSNLQLLGGESDVTVSAAGLDTGYSVALTETGFNVTLTNGIAAHTPITITYRATIIKVDEVDNNGNVTNIGNTAMVTSGNETPVELPYTPTYTPGREGIKENGGVSSQDGKVTWTVTVNPNGDRNVSGVVVKDALQDEGLIYDTSTPIQCNVTGLENLDWDSILAADGRSWSYTLPKDAGYKTFVFTYKTIVPESSEKVQYSNIVTIDGKTADSSSVEVPGTGTGTGTGTGVTKKFDHEQTVGNDRYVWWTSTVRVPKEGANGVVYTDELSGSHVLEADDAFRKNLSIIDQDGKAVTHAQFIRNSDKKFTINFGNIAPADKERVYTISYRTKVEANGSVYNVGILEANGITRSAPSKYVVQEYSFKKSGTVTDKENGIITWKITLNDGTFDLGRTPITIVDTFSSNLVYVGGSAKLFYEGQEETEKPSVTGTEYKDNNGNTVGLTSPITISVGQISGKSKYELQYQTKLISPIPTGESPTYTNTATIKQGDKVLGEPSAPVTVSNRVVSKSAVQKASSKNNFTAGYEVLLNEEYLSFDEDVTTFHIQDTMSDNQTLDRDSVVVQRQKQGSSKWTVVPDDEVTMTLLNHSIDIVIKTEPENINKCAYRLKYTAHVSKDINADQVPYTNDVTYTVAGKDYSAGSDETADFGQETQGSGTGSTYWFKIKKGELGVFGSALAGAVFNLYAENTAAGEEPELIKEGLITDANGMITFGNDTAKVPSENKVTLYTNQKYILVEKEAPAGYLKADEVTFYLADDKDHKDGWTSGSTHYIDDERKTRVELTKEWEGVDANDLPEVSFELYRKYEGEDDSAYALVEGSEKILPTAVKDNGKLTASLTWDNLPYHELVGSEVKKVVYTVKETFKNTEDAKKYSTQIGTAEEKTETIDTKSFVYYTINVKNATTQHTVNKVWNDSKNALGNRPDSITVHLKRGNEVIATQTLKAKDNWSYTWTGLPKYDANGNAYTYTAVEAPVPTYYVQEDGSPSTTGTVTTITNKPESNLVEKTVTKVWDDAGNQDGIRPTTIWVQLYENGVPVDVDGAGKAGLQELTVNNQIADDANKWSFTWTNLQKYKNKAEIVYTVKEGTKDASGNFVPADGNYPSTATGKQYTVSQDGFTITNTWAPATEKLQVEKSWATVEGHPNDDGNRPANVFVSIYKRVGNGDKVIVSSLPNNSAGQGQTAQVTLNEENSWTYTWENLPSYEGGQKITYSVEETVPAHYSTPSYVKGTVEGGNKITITNTYVPEFISVSAKKTWVDNNNADGKRGAVSFQLQKKNSTIDNGEWKDVGDRITVSDGSGNVWTSNTWKWENLLKYENGAENHYQVVEVEKPNGYSSSSPAVVPEQGGTVNITNTYASSTTATLQVKKNLTGNRKQRDGKPFSAGEFEFELYQGETTEASKLLQTVGIDADGNAKFQALTYGQAGTYTYTIKEKVGNVKGVTYAGGTVKATVTVEVDSKDPGKLKATVAYTASGDNTSVQDNAAVFTNAYHATGSATIPVTKTLQNATLQDGMFEFALYDTNGNIVTRVRNTGNSFTLPTPVYTESDIGNTYTYTVKEIVPANAAQDPYNYNISKNEYTVNISISDNGDGTLKVQPFLPGVSSAAFANEYVADGSLSIGVQKTVVSANDTSKELAVPTSGKFTFVLSERQENGSYKEIDNVLYSPASGNTVNFKNISYNSEDIGKTFYYRVTENQGSLPGYTYSTEVYEVEVTVSDGQNGKLKIESKVLKNNEQVSAASDVPVTVNFTNSYKAEGTIALEATKTLSGKDLKDGMFTFELYKTENGKETPVYTGEKAVTNKDGKVTFPALTFNESQLGEHHYIIREKVNENSTSQIGDQTYGYEYSEDIPVTVKVTEDDVNARTGSLTVKAYNADGKEISEQNPIKISNQYTALGSTELEVSKILNGRGINETDTPRFTFTLTAANENTPVPSQTTAESDETGKARFSLSYDEDDAGKTYEYLLKESKPEQTGGYTYSTEEYKVTVQIIDQNNGQLQMKKTIIKIGSENQTAITVPTFTNRYEATGETTISGTKKLTGKKLEAGEFQFELLDAKGNPVLDENQKPVVVTNDAEGNFSFEKFSYKRNAEKNDVGTYVYKVRETNQKTNGYEYDLAVYTVTITVKDPGTGSLSVTQAITQETTAVEGIVFNNTYSANGTPVIKAYKTLDGRILENEQFTFSLKDSDGKVIEEATNSGTEVILGSKIQYTQNDIDKTFKYTLEEKPDETMEGYTFSNVIYTVIVKVTNAGEGKLATEVFYYAGDISIEETKKAVPIQPEKVVFQNIYKATGSITLGGIKYLERKNLEEKQFAFELKDESGKLLDTAYSRKTDGTFAFKAREYDQKDVLESGSKDFVYYISEKAGEDSTYSYCDWVYKVTVTVKDNGDGTLTTSKKVELESGTDTKRADTDKMNFVNEYKPTGELELTATKSLKGRNLEKDQFSFVLYGDGQYQKVTNTEEKEKNVTFTLSFDENDIDKTYHYFVSEVDDRKTGYTYSDMIYSVEVYVEDDNNGRLIPHTTMKNVATGETVDEMVFENEYHATGKLNLEAWKKVLGKDVLDTFTFELSGTDIQTQVKTNDAFGKVAFDTISYNENDIGKTFEYKVQEKDTKLGGYTYSSEIYTVKVTVADAGNATLVATPVITDSVGNTVTSMEFVNSYSAEGAITLKAKKSMDADLKETTLKEGEYTFSVKENGKEVASGTNDAEGNVTFTEITYQTKPDDQSALGEHTYEITETAGTDGTVIYDDTKYTVTVMVSDAGAGKLDAEITDIVKGKEIVDDSEAVAFVNGVTRVEISKKILGSLSTKELPGAVLQIEDADGNVVIEPWTTGETAKYLEGVLEAGKTYYLVETAAPAGYVKAEKVPFTVSADGSIDKVEMFDDTVKVNVTKKDITNDEELPGATLQVIKQILDAEGNVTKEEVLESWTSTEKAHTIETKLTTGEEYVLREITAPDGYVRATDVKFKVEETGKIQTVEMVDDITRIQISKVDITDQKELAGAHLALKDEEGKIIAEWTSDGTPKEFYGQLTAGAMYTLTEISAPVGYDLARDITFTVEETGEIQKIVMEDEVADGKGKITVQKLVMMDNKYMAVDYTFYTALFADEALTERVSGVRPIYVNGSYTGSTTFSNLKEGTYYVAETDQSGTPIVETDFIEMNQILDGKAEITPEQSTAKSTIINHISTPGEEYYKDGEITVDKKVLVNGEEANVDDTFYFALFVDSDMTMMADAGIKELRLEDASRGTVLFENLPYGEYYLAEVDEEGVPVDEDFAYTVTISSYCKLDEANSSVTCEVTNSKTEEEEDGEETTTPDDSDSGNGGGKSSGSNNATKTGDTTPIRTYLILLCGSVAVLFAVFGKKRKKGKHE